MTPTVPPTTIRYLSAADVLAAMPPMADRLLLAERTMIALVADAQVPPKIGVHQRPEGSFAHAMPAYLRGSGADGGDDLLGMKWVAGAPANHLIGLPAISATVIMSDPVTGQTVAILDGGPITALRTAAVSGVAIVHFGPGSKGGPAPLDRVVRCALIGAGVQGHSHVEMIGHVLPGVRLTIIDRDRRRADALAALAATTPGIGEVRAIDDPAAATRTADVVVSAASFTDPAHRQVMDGSWLAPDALIVPVDYATMLAASVADDAGLFLVDDVRQFVDNRDAGQFAGYPDPTASLGAAIRAGIPRPTSGRVVVTHLGIGLADVIFGDAIVRRATAMGLGVELTR